jgi:hypothetical protein
MKEHAPELNLQPETIAFLASIGAGIDIDIYSAD